MTSHPKPVSPLPSASHPVAPVPAWLRQAVAAQDGDDAAFAAGAALAALDVVVRRQERWAGGWRMRLALGAATVTARRMGRVEGEAALRDALLLTRPGDDAGPAGRLLLAWRLLAMLPAKELLDARNLAAMLDGFGHAHADKAAGDLAGALRPLSAGTGMAGLPGSMLAVAERHGFEPAIGCWLADAALAQRLGWAHAIPLLGTEEPGRARTLPAAQARAALRAIDAFVALERPAGRLLAVAPKLRAKAAGAVVERLLSDDAIVASERIAGISDRGLRRLFDRLIELGALRELSGRTTFRIYGL